MNGRRLLVLEKEISRRGFLSGLFRSTAISASLGMIAPHLWGLRRPTDQERETAASVYNTIGSLTVPEDEDPGWATFEPGIGDYGLNVFLRQILFNGDLDAFDAYIETLNHLNNVPALVNYNAPFLRMSDAARQKYLSDILTGQFESDGWQDVLTLAAGLAIVSVKMTFFSNYPRHLSRPGLDPRVRTGWELMRWKGPVGLEEERALRAAANNVVEIPGIDPRNPFV